MKEVLDLKDIVIFKFPSWEYDWKWKSTVEHETILPATDFWAPSNDNDIVDIEMWTKDWHEWLWLENWRWERSFVDITHKLYEDKTYIHPGMGKEELKSDTLYHCDWSELTVACYPTWETSLCPSLSNITPFNLLDHI